MQKIQRAFLLIPSVNSDGQNDLKVIKDLLRKTHRFKESAFTKVCGEHIGASIDFEKYIKIVRGLFLGEPLLPRNTS